MTGLNSELMPPEASFNPWNFRPDVAVEVSGAKLTGYKVEAVDGASGKVVDASLAPDSSFLVVLLGRVFGRRVLLPAGTVNHVDQTELKVYVDRTREQIKDIPEIVPESYDDPVDREKVASYFQATY